MIALSFDVEPDFPPHYDTFDGVEGLKVVVELLRECKCNATFFVCAELLDKKPGIIDFMKGFEIGCHSLRHVDLTKLSEFQVSAEIAEAYETFEEHGVKVYGFRAPYCSVNYTVLSAVKKYFEYDSSMQFYSFGRMPGLPEAPVYTGGKIFGLNPAIFNFVAGLPVKDKVFFAHPWEYGGFDFGKVLERRRNLKALGYSRENYVTNLKTLLKQKTCSVKDIIQKQ
ncbi:MAG: polysaccharide deacetylase family protein [Candidatus Altiarchaeota archaeon]|nr:polysaccharide deacetylase family protein [Candidatus Altiarchaeota archaeon]